MPAERPVSSEAADQGWQAMEFAPLDGTIIEGMNRSMEMPVDMCWGVYRLVIGYVVDRDETGWHVPYGGETIFPDFWRHKTTGDELGLFRFEALVEWPPLPERVSP